MTINVPETRRAEGLSASPRTGQARLAREFARARRQGRIVRVLKIGLPIIALAIVGGGLAMTWLARTLPDNLSVDSTSIENGRVVMQDPRMSGVDKQDRPYQLIAQRAFQSLTGGGVDLEHVTAKLAISDDANAEIKAAAGHYDQDTQKLNLSQGISVDTTSGIAVRLQKASIDIASGSLNGSGPVRIDTPTQTIRSQTVEFAKGGSQLTFGGGVKMTLKPSSSSTPQTQASTSE